ncbi:MAG: YraN family protein [Patescibacteria group bacterium]
MTFARKADGQRGEALAEAFLAERGFLVVARNWTHRLGEIDLIVERDGEIRFIEVKYRNTLMFGYPEEAVTGKKLRHLSRAIECWLEEQVRPPMRYQVDVVAITAVAGQPVDYHWVEDVYQ